MSRDHVRALWLSVNVLLLLVGQIKATNIEAKSVSFADVSAAVVMAKDGDTVLVPKGTATWVTPLRIDKHRSKEREPDQL